MTKLQRQIFYPLMKDIVFVNRFDSSIHNHTHQKSNKRREIEGEKGGGGVK